MANNNFYRYDLAYEKAVLGTLLLQRDAIHQVREILSVDCFYDQWHQNVYKAILAMSSRGERADMITVGSELKKMSIEFQPFDIVDLTNSQTFDLTQYALYLSDLEKGRRMHDIGQYLISATSKGIDDISDILQKANDDLSGVFGNIANHVKTGANYLEEVYNRVNDNLNGVAVVGSKTGFRKIDKRGGFQPGNLIILAGQSSMGKTALANAIILNVLKSGENIAFYSMEMTGRELMTRFAAVEANLPVLKLSNERLTDNEYSLFNQAVGRLEKLGIYFDDRSTSNIETILSSIRSMAIKHHIKGAVIDYLQILNVNKKGNSNSEELLADIARRLKNLAKELNIWILALSQLNRDAKDPIPTVDRLRGSGQINEAADLTILLHRPEVFGKKKAYPEPFEKIDPKGTSMIDIAKGRNTGPYKFIVGFDGRTTKFYNLDKPQLLASKPEDDKPF